MKRQSLITLLLLATIIGMSTAGCQTNSKDQLLATT